MLGKTEGKSRTVCQRMRSLDSIPDSTDISLCKLREIVKPGVLQSMGLQRVGHGLATEHEHVDKKTKYFTLSKEISKTLIIKHLKSKNHFIIV